MDKIKKDIKNKSFENIYLFYGEEDYLKKKYEEEIKNTVIASDFDVMNFNIYEGNKIDIAAVTEVAETLPFMNDYRIIVIKNSELFYKGQKDSSDKIEAYIKDIPHSTIFIFVEKKVDKRSKLFKAVNKVGYCVNFEIPNENELSAWICSIAKEHNKKIDTLTALHIVRTVGGTMETIKTELDKLIDYKFDSDIITNVDVDKICTKSLESHVFELVEHIGNKNAAAALQIYNNLLSIKESPIVILTMIARQFRIIMQSKYLHIKRSYSSQQIAVEMGYREFMVKQALRQSSNFTVRELIKALEECLECDIKMKTGQINSITAVELIIIKYASI